MIDRPRILVDPVPDAPVGKLTFPEGLEFGDDEFQVVEFKRASHRIGGKIAVDQQVFVGAYLPKSKYPGHKVKNVGPGKYDVEIRAIAFRFGVVSVKNTGEYLANCRAEGSWRLPGEEGWHPAGKLNWNSEERKRELQSRPKEVERITRRVQAGLNEYLKNPEINVSRNETAFLPLFYMMDGRPEVFLSGTASSQKSGLADDRVALEFEYRLWIMGEDLDQTEYMYRINANWDHFSIRRTNTPTPWWKFWGS